MTGFQRAIERGRVLAAETAARELGALSLSEVFARCLLYEREGDPPHPSAPGDVVLVALAPKRP